VELAAGFAAQPLHAYLQGAVFAAPEEALTQRNLALEPHQVSYQEQVAVDTQIQADKKYKWKVRKQHYFTILL
jgi:hypothetical protein